MKAPAIPVTAHAVLRYLTRIEGFDLRPLVRQLGRDAGNWHLARAAAQAFGTTIEDIQRRVLPEHLEAEVRAGVAQVRRAGMVLICDGHRVVTFVEKTTIKAKILSKREIRRGCQRSDRRTRFGR